jgi:hypothetical protein
LIAPCDYREYLIEYSPEDAVAMRREAEEFLTTVHRDERPAIDGSDATYQAIRELHPDIDPRDHRVPDELAVSYLRALAAANAAAEEKQRQTSLLADEMGTARRALWGEECIAMRVAKNGGTPHVRAANFVADRLGKTA